MTDFREDLHPRSGNGQFASKEGWPPEVGLNASSGSPFGDRRIIGFRGSPESPSVHSLKKGEDFQLGYGEPSDEETERVLAWVEAEGVTATATYKGFGKYADDAGLSSGRDTYNYDITLRTEDGREFNIEYHMGSALTTAPTIADVLQSSAMDSYSLTEYDKDEYIRELGGFQEYGYDEDETRRGAALYEAVEKQDAGFKEFVGDDFDYIIYGE